MPLCSVSVVSHNQARLVASFLDDVERHCSGDLEVVVVVNVPEDEEPLRRPWRMPVRVVRNAARKGFGANHNAAFCEARGDVFVVANPDVRLTADPLPALARTLATPGVGICAPKVVAPDGRTEDSFRRFPSVPRLVARHLSRRRVADYVVGAGPIEVDWVAGMFMALRRDTYAALRGFDERYFMYLEDVDLCRRAHVRRLRVLMDPSISVVHDARRATLRDPRHLRWHLRSMWRYLTSTDAGRERGMRSIIPRASEVARRGCP